VTRPGGTLVWVVVRRGLGQGGTRHTGLGKSLAPVGARLFVAV